MICTQEDLTIDCMKVPTNVFVDVGRAIAVGQRRLMVSDNPEVLNSSSLPEMDGTLWHDIVRTDESSVMHRIFGWHVNETGEPLQLGITVQNLSASDRIVIQNIRRDIYVQPNMNQMIKVGQCLAKSCLSGTMEHYTPIEQGAALQRTALIESVELERNHFAGFIYEFTVARNSNAGEMEYVIRSVASRKMDADLRVIHSVPIPSFGTHPRGTWVYSEVHATLPAYIIGTDSVYRVCARKTMSGTEAADMLFTASTSEIQEGAIDNIGHFGAVYTVNIPLHNNTGEQTTVNIRLNPRGGAYAGAILVNGQVKGVPIMRDNTNVCMIAKVAVPVGESSFSCKLMTAGESNLPLAIYVTSQPDQG